MAVSPDTDYWKVDLSHGKASAPDLSQRQAWRAAGRCGFDCNGCPSGIFNSGRASSSGRKASSMGSLDFGSVLDVSDSGNEMSEDGGFKGI